MSPVAPGPAEASGTADATAVQWAAFIAGNHLVLECLSIVEEEVDVFDAVLLTALIQANVASLAGDRDLQAAYATIDAPPPDDVRRAISVTALATSLNLPFETVRRRLARLARAGACESVDRGYRVPTKILGGEAHAHRLLTGWNIMRANYFKVRDAGCLENLAAVPLTLMNSGEPVRILARAGSEYALRAVSMLAETLHDPADIFIVMALIDINSGGNPAARPGWPLRPARASEVAQALRTPYETVRRRLTTLAAKGYCTRTANGWVLPGERLAALTKGMLDENLTNLRRLFATLARFGALDMWEREADAAAGRHVPA